MEKPRAPWPSSYTPGPPSAGPRWGLKTCVSNTFPGAAAGPLLYALLPPNRNIKHLAHRTVLNGVPSLSLSFCDSAGDLSKGAKGITWQHGASHLSLDRLRCMALRIMTAIPCTCVLAHSLASRGLSFLICKMGGLDTLYAQIAQSSA